MHNYNLKLNSSIHRLIKFLLYSVVVIVLISISTVQAQNTITAKTNGTWNSTATWNPEVVPSNGDIVIIPDGYEVEYGEILNARIAEIHIMGKLVFSSSIDSYLKVETIMVDSTGILEIGNSNQSLYYNKTCTIEFIDNGPIVPYTSNKRGLLVKGSFFAYGFSKAPFFEIDGEALIGKNFINVVPSTYSWLVGDRIVIPGTKFTPGEIPYSNGDELNETGKATVEEITDNFQDEVVTITSISGKKINFDKNLNFDHKKSTSKDKIHVANLTRNIKFVSEAEDYTRRAHTMYMPGSTVEIKGIEFTRMGRTNKRFALDDLEFKGATREVRKKDINKVTNHRGRYAVHFHKNNANVDSIIAPLATVSGCVVEDAIGWGYVNHQSHVDFIENVCFNFNGAGFVTENGAELGTFDGNIAIQGYGNGELRPQRQVFANIKRHQSLGDFGFSGDGFWFQGPMVKVRNNVAASCNGAGFFWFGSGAIEPDAIGTEYSYGHYVGIPESLMKAVYQYHPNLVDMKPRIHTAGYEDKTEKYVAIVDLPIKEFKNNQAYSSHIGAKLKFNNHNSTPFLKSFAPYDTLIKGWPIYGNQVVDGLDLWNNMHGFIGRYVTNTDLKNVRISNNQAYKYFGAQYDIAALGIQAEQNTSRNSGDNFAIENVEVNGYGRGLRLSSAHDTSNVTVNNEAIDIHYNKDFTFNCDPLKIDKIETLNSEVKVYYQNRSDLKSILLRYKKTTDFGFSFLEDKSPDGQIDFVVPPADLNIEYQVQILGGCTNNNAMHWSFPMVVSISEDCTAMEDDFCDDSNPVTSSDMFNDNCNCIGELLDSDGDGMSDYSELAECRNPYNAGDMEFAYTYSSQNWYATDVQSIVTNNAGSTAILNTGTTNSSPQFIIDKLNANTSQVGLLQIIFTASVAGKYKIYWSTDAKPTYDDQFIELDYTGGTQIFNVDFSANNFWDSNTKIRSLRFDPPPAVQNKITIKSIKSNNGAPSIIGTTCNDGNVNTINDVYDAYCNCTGITLKGCNTINFEDFETGWGIWNDGGQNAGRNNNSTYASSGTYAAVIKDNTNNSVITTDALNLTAYNEIEINFNYYPLSMDNSSEDFWLQISTNGGGDYTTIQTWAKEIDFNNNTSYAESVSVAGPFTATTKIRFRCDASGFTDYVYLDDIEINGCNSDINNCPTFGQSCDDGDICTIGETYDANCSCSNGTFEDDDSDGICNANDVCSNGDDTIDEDGDGIPNACDICPNDPGNTCGRPTSYCSSSGTNAIIEYIANVSFGSINNTSGANGGYSDFTSHSTMAVLGNTIPISLTAGYASTTYPENWKVWIDFNRDGDFYDAGEEVFADTANGTIIGSITIPATANVGVTAMRVSMQWSAASQPCGIFTYGEVEDYTVTIAASAGRLPTTANMEEENTMIEPEMLNVYPNPVNTHINVDMLKAFNNINADKQAIVKIYSTDGKLMKHANSSNVAVLSIDVNDLPSNQYYFISVEIENSKRLSANFLKY